MSRTGSTAALSDDDDDDIDEVGLPDTSPRQRAFDALDALGAGHLPSAVDAEEDEGEATRIDAAPRGARDDGDEIGLSIDAADGDAHAGAIDRRPTTSPALAAEKSVQVESWMQLHAQPRAAGPTPPYLGTPSYPPPAHPPFAPDTRESPLARALDRVRDTAARLTSTQLIAAGAVLTLLLVGVVLALVMTCAGDGEGDADPRAARARQARITGSIIITTTPLADCTVSVGPIKRLASGTVSLSGVVAGDHRVTLNCAGFRMYRRTISVRAGQLTHVKAVLER